MKKASLAYITSILMLVLLSSSLMYQACMAVPAGHEKASITTIDGNIVTGYGVETTTEGMVTYYKSKDDKEANKGKVSIPKDRVKSITDLKTE